MAQMSILSVAYMFVTPFSRNKLTIDVDVVSSDNRILGTEFGLLFKDL
jgi:hypothetical protein